MQDPKKSPKIACHLGTIAQLCRAISSQLRHVSTIGKKNLLSSNISSTCPHNMVNFGPLMAEICWRVWGTPTNFNGFCVLAALLHGTLVVSVSQTAALNRGRHLYSAGRPSRWALAHISSCDRPTGYGMHFPAILSNYNGMTAYICRRFIPTTAFLVMNIIQCDDLLSMQRRFSTCQNSTRPQKCQLQHTFLRLVTRVLLTSLLFNSITRRQGI